MQKNKTVIFIIMALLILTGVYNYTDSSNKMSGFYSASGSSVFESFSDPSPSKNNVNAIIFLIEFQDVKFNPEYSNSYSGDRLLTSAQLEQAVFGKENTSSIHYPYESVSAYYKRASYGEYNLTGIVKPYTTKYNRDYYDSTKTSEDGDTSIGYEKLAMEVMNYYDSEIDFSQYDSNNDGLLDNIYFSVPLNGEDSDKAWWGNQSTWTNHMAYNVDGEYISKYVILDGQPFDGNITYYNQICIHETGHLMGLPDYYDTKASNDDFEGFDGMAGFDMMDEMTGDHNAFSKIMLGWIKNTDVEVADTSSSKDYALTSIEETKNVLLIPINSWDNNFCSEYYLLEYDNETYNNASAAFEYTNYLTDEDTIIDLQERDGGIRIWHVNAKLTKDYWEQECKMFAYDSNTTDSKEHVLELISNPEYVEDGFFRVGDKITLPNDFTITVKELIDGTYHISIDKKN
jgi:M6 family metalloprotease-like protein